MNRNLIEQSNLGAAQRNPGLTKFQAPEFRIAPRQDSLHFYAHVAKKGT